MVVVVVAAASAVVAVASAVEVVVEVLISRLPPKTFLSHPALHPPSRRSRLQKSVYSKVRSLLQGPITVNVVAGCSLRD